MQEHSLGDVKQAPDIGKPGREYYSWVECPICGEQRWAPKRSIQGTRRMCKDCTLNNAKSNLKIGKNAGPPTIYTGHSGTGRNLF